MPIQTYKKSSFKLVLVIISISICPYKRLRYILLQFFRKFSESSYIAN